MQAAKLFDLTGEVALVTGASSGLGARFAQVLAANGAKVVLLARRAERLKALKARIEDAGGAALIAEADVTSRAALAAAFDAAEKAFGTVTIAIANAGIADVAKFVDMSEAHWRKVLATNLDAVVATDQEAARRMIAAGKPGAIINIASILGFGVGRGVAAYAVSKAAVIQATKALALEVAHRGIRVNAIAPGYISTEINAEFLTSERGEALRRAIPAGRFGHEEDLDGALLLLASDAGRFMSGSVLTVDGGHMLPLMS